MNRPKCFEPNFFPASGSGARPGTPKKWGTQDWVSLCELAEFPAPPHLPLHPAAGARIARKWLRSGPAHAVWCVVAKPLFRSLGILIVESWKYEFATFACRFFLDWFFERISVEYSTTRCLNVVKLYQSGKPSKKSAFFPRKKLPTWSTLAPETGSTEGSTGRGRWAMQRWFNFDRSQDGKSTLQKARNTWNGYGKHTRWCPSSLAKLVYPISRFHGS